MTVLWCCVVGVSVLFGLLGGTLDAVSAAALSGAASAVTLCLSMAGALCLWTGVMEVMERSGLAAKLARLFRPPLRRFLPQASRDTETLAAVSANVSANLLGLGNAATPLGLKAASRMAKGTGGVASDELCLLVVLNTASIQLIPATVASLRAAAGCETPFDILPAVWLTSLLALAAGLADYRAFCAAFRRRFGVTPLQYQKGRQMGEEPFSRAPWIGWERGGGTTAGPGDR